ncbi:integral membrane protein [Colletotrichum plurivorum]|uniref:Integral membrane protein n=1 Tax=Colletotrichum plurivorum TaxID=2175906 RepID=A0A8H6K2S2_9PEZI|nr:integral membrane protein [Colletotrichum plurivorum]
MLLLLLPNLIKISAAADTQTLTGLISQVPDCALPCIITGLPKGGCKLTSVSAITDCLCPNIDIQADLSMCVQQSCFFTDQTRAAALQTNLCVAYPKPSRAKEARNIAIALSALTFPVVLLRCVSRWLATKRLWWDDWMVVIATIFLAGMAAVQIAGTTMGFGLHYWNVDPAASTRLIQLFYAGQLLYILVQVCAKISILLLFSRVFAASKWLQQATKIFIAFLVLHGATFLLIVVFECTPISSTWDLTNPNRKCLDITAIGYSGAGFSIVEDFAILLLPIPELIRLQLTTKRKFGLGFMFSLGSFACITSMVRLKFLIKIATTFDVTWDNVDIIVWSLVEVFCAILCASLPALRPLLQTLRGRMTTKDSSSGSSPNRTNWDSPKHRHHHDTIPSANMTRWSMDSIPQRRSVFDFGRDKLRELRQALQAPPVPSLPTSDKKNRQTMPSPPRRRLTDASESVPEAGSSVLDYGKDSYRVIRYTLPASMSTISAGETESTMPSSKRRSFLEYGKDVVRKLSFREKTEAPAELYLSPINTRIRREIAAELDWWDKSSHMSSTQMTTSRVPSSRRPASQSSHGSSPGLIQEAEQVSRWSGHSSIQRSDYRYSRESEGESIQNSNRWSFQPSNHGSIQRSDHRTSQRTTEAEYC